MVPARVVVAGLHGTNVVMKRCWSKILFHRCLLLHGVPQTGVGTIVRYLQRRIRSVSPYLPQPCLLVPKLTRSCAGRCPTPRSVTLWHSSSRNFGPCDGWAFAEPSHVVWFLMLVESPASAGAQPECTESDHPRAPSSKGPSLGPSECTACLELAGRCRTLRPVCAGVPKHAEQRSQHA